MGAPRTLTFGLSVNGPLAELASLSEFGRPLAPQFVYWLYAEENDLNNLAVELTSPRLMQYMAGGYSQNLIARQPEVDLLLKQRANQLLVTYAQWRAPDHNTYQWDYVWLDK